MLYVMIGPEASSVGSGLAVHGACKCSQGPQPMDAVCALVPWQKPLGFRITGFLVQGKRGLGFLHLGFMAKACKVQAYY